MFTKRLISSITIVVLTILAVLLGGKFLLGSVAILSLLALYEFYHVFTLERKPIAWFGYAMGMAYDLFLGYGNQKFLFFFFLIFLCFLLSYYVFLFPSISISQVQTILFGFFYVNVLFGLLYQIRILQDGLAWIVFVFIGAWGSDTVAYCIGSYFGKHKMTPRLSPKKTIEGAVGGIAGSMIIGCIYAACLHHIQSAPDLSIGGVAILCGLTSIFAQLGDLAASGMKRNYGIKDYGKIIPGHGGILDRFDSILFTAPIIFFVITIIII